MTYFRVKFNPELNFQGKLLDQHGFVPREHCGADVGFYVLATIKLN